MKFLLLISVSGFSQILSVNYTKLTYTMPLKAKVDI